MEQLPDPLTRRLILDLYLHTRSQQAEIAATLGLPVALVAAVLDVKV